MTKRPKSLVWNFFNKVEDENNKCVAVLCRLCDAEYKFFGNTTNLRVHLTKKHPLQWSLSETNIEGAVINLHNDASPIRAATRKRKLNSIYDNSDTQENLEQIEEDTNASVTLVRQMNENGDEEWLEETALLEENDDYQVKPKLKLKSVKREWETPPRRISTYIPHVTHSEKPKVVIQSNLAKDEYDLFGDYIANKLKKISNTQVRGNVQQLISTLLWQSEQGAFNDIENVKKTLIYLFQVEMMNNADNSIKEQTIEIDETEVS